LRSINLTAPILLPADHDLDPKGLVDIANDRGGITFDAIPPMAHILARPGVAPCHADRYDTFFFSWHESTAWEDFKSWLEALLIARGDSILRMKGLLQIVGGANPVVIQSVQHALYPPKVLKCWPHGTPRSEIVFVTRDFARDAALRSFNQFLPYQLAVA
jgi:G3E family GTPase